MDFASKSVDELRLLRRALMGTADEAAKDGAMDSEDRVIEAGVHELIEAIEAELPRRQAPR